MNCTSRKLQSGECRISRKLKNESIPHFKRAKQNAILYFKKVKNCILQEHFQKIHSQKALCIINSKAKKRKTALARFQNSQVPVHTGTKFVGKVFFF